MLTARRLALLALAGVLGAIIYATAAPASQQAGPSRGEFNALKKRVTKVEKNANDALALLGGCLQRGVPVSRYNNYVAVDSANNLFKTTGLDVDTTSAAPQAFVLDIGPTCAAAIAQTLHIHFQHEQLQPRQAMRVLH
jgi:hypothetical protein